MGMKKKKQIKCFQYLDAIEVFNAIQSICLAIRLFVLSSISCHFTPPSYDLSDNIVGEYTYMTPVAHIFSQSLLELLCFAKSRDCAYIN